LSYNSNLSMDISVSFLNERMALQLPAELPLGLVFVVGSVRQVESADSSGNIDFQLEEKVYTLRCRLLRSTADKVNIQVGDKVRAGGHLAFDTERAAYFLLARDIEILSDQRSDLTAPAPVLLDIKKRSQAANLTPARLPNWVKEMAPPEIKPELKDLEQAAEDEPVLTNGDVGSDTLAEPRPESEHFSTALPGGLTEELVQFLSEAMDSPEEVELTPEMIKQLTPTLQPSAPQRAAPLPELGNGTSSMRRWWIGLLVLLLVSAFLVTMILLTFYLQQ
jgi:hypothetical protein